MSLEKKQIGVFGVEDTGAPSSSNYTTVVLIHGYTVQSLIFHPLLPFASKHNSRLVLLNRRDYPGAKALSTEELAPLQGEPTKEALEEYMTLRAKEVYDFLREYVKQEDVPAISKDGKEGGIVVVGWSFGAGWITALLAYISQFESDADVELEKYIKRFVLLDPPYMALGFPPHAQGWNPLLDPSIPHLEAVQRVFPTWLTSYFTHGTTPESFAIRDPTGDIPPTISKMSGEQLGTVFYPPPGGETGSDTLITRKGMGVGLWGAMREKAVLRAGPKGSEGWEGIELRSVWCDRSVWEMIWATWCFQQDLEEKKKDQAKAKELRKITFVKLKGANHFPHWDYPEQTLEALLDDSLEEHSV